MGDGLLRETKRSQLRAPPWSFADYHPRFTARRLGSVALHAPSSRQERMPLPPWQTVRATCRGRNLRPPSCPGQRCSVRTRSDGPLPDDHGLASSRRPKSPSRPTPDSLWNGDLSVRLPARPTWIARHGRARQTALIPFRAAVVVRGRPPQNPQPSPPRSSDKREGIIRDGFGQI